MSKRFLISVESADVDGPQLYATAVRLGNAGGMSHSEPHELPGTWHGSTSAHSADTALAAAKWIAVKAGAKAWTASVHLHSPD